LFLVHVSCPPHYNKNYTFVGRKRLLNLFTDAPFNIDSWRTEKAAVLFIVPRQVGTLKSGIMSATFSSLASLSISHTMKRIQEEIRAMQRMKDYV
jgi:hypothetical protein